MFRTVIAIELFVDLACIVSMLGVVVGESVLVDTFIGVNLVVVEVVVVSVGVVMVVGGLVVVLIRHSPDFELHSCPGQAASHLSLQSRP